MSKTRKDSVRSNGSAPRNYAAYSMIVNRTGIKQVFADRRSKRSRDFRNSWQNDCADDIDG